MACLEHPGRAAGGGGRRAPGWRAEAAVDDGWSSQHGCMPWQQRVACQAHNVHHLACWLHVAATQLGAWQAARVVRWSTAAAGPSGGRSVHAKQCMDGTRLADEACWVCQGSHHRQWDTVHDATRRCRTGRPHPGWAPASSCMRWFNAQLRPLLCICCVPAADGAPWAGVQCSTAVQGGERRRMRGALLHGPAAQLACPMMMHPQPAPSPGTGALCRRQAGRRQAAGGRRGRPPQELGAACMDAHWSCQMHAGAMGRLDPLFG